MPSKYEMWMTHNNSEDRLMFPVLPEIVQVRKGNASQSVRIQGLGEVIIANDPEAPTINFSSFFPAKPFPGIQVDRLTPPNVLREKIESWQASDKPVRWFVTGLTEGGFYRIENFMHHEQGGDVGTIYYSLVLKAYRAIKVRQVQIQQQKAFIPPPAPSPQVAPARVDNRVVPRTHTVVKGDTLWGIAARYFDNGKRCSKIHKLNKDKIKNPN